MQAGKSLLPFLLLTLHFQSSVPVISHSYFHLSQYPNRFPKLKELKVLHSWKQVEFAFPTSESRQELLDGGHYIPGNSAIIDSDFWSVGGVEKLFVTLPRLRPGIPITLARVTNLRGVEKSPLLQPYPDWSWHGDGDCEGIISVFRIKIDECQRLWVVDTGVIDALNTQKKICPAKILVFDLFTDTLVMKYVFPDSVVPSDSLLVTVVVDVRGTHCFDTFAYIADVTKFGIVVFDYRSRSSWRISSNIFYPFPTHGSFNIAGEEFDLMDGILGLALSPLQINGEKTLYFHSLASVREGKVSANLLKNSSNFENGHNLVSKRFLISSDVRPSQSAAQDMSHQGILFFGLLSSSSIACWNYKLPYLSSNIVPIAQSNKTLQFPSGVKVIWRNGREELLVTTSKFHRYILGKVDSSDDNYHILSAPVSELVRGTFCDPSVDIFTQHQHLDNPFYHVRRTLPWP